RQVFSDLQRPRFGTAGNYDALGLFGSCDPSRRQLYTCILDAGFTQAIRQANGNKPLSVADAIAAGYLHRDWPLVREGTAADQDPLCYQGPPNGGYCASNLAKMRAARIIPIGWELAANHPKNTPGDGKISGSAPPVTLGFVIDAFNKNGDDGKCGTGDGNEDPYCGLIDPNWILRYPDQQCRLRAPTEMLAQAGSPIRSEECRDAPSCLAQDADGRCVSEGTADRVGGYGYCVREKNVWHLNGTSCPASSASCRVLTPRVGNQTALLTSTVDRSVCNAGNAGCAWYSTARSASGWRTDQRRYFTGAVERCQEREEGCTELIDMKVAQRNLIRNGGFSDDAVGQVPSFWSVQRSGTGTPNPMPTLVVTESGPVHGKFLRCRGDLYGGSVCSTIQSQTATAAIDPATIQPESVYTLSASVRVQVNPSSADASDVRIVFQDVTGAHQACAITIPVHERDDQWRQYQVRCVTDVQILQPRIVVLDGTDNDAITTIDVDDLMLLEGDVQAPFHEGYADQAQRTYLKVAPADLRCEDIGSDGRLNTANDDASCPSFARACTADDVGCTRYTPVGGNAPAVDGRVSALDYCPAACVGYAAFREVDSTFDGSADLAYFIPSTARQCSVEDVGCSEFTVLDAERGGEQREYYSDIRRCDKPGTGSSATYYTWEGSDQGGYQLRSFTLRASSADGNSAPAVFGDQATADCQAAYGKSPGQPDYDPIRTPDCRAFYTQNGTIHYRPISRTVIVTDDCVQFRASHVMSDALCTERGGTVASGQCIIHGYRPESRSCSVEAAGCRAYRGNAGGAVRTIIATDFEPAIAARQGWNAGTPSNESLTVGGHSLELGANQETAYPARETIAGLTREDCDARSGVFTDGSGTTPSQCVAPLLHASGTYELLLVGRGAAEVTATLEEQVQNLAPGGDPKRATFGAAWRQASLGPFIVTGTPTTNSVLKIAVGAGGVVHFDQIVLREVPQLTTIVKQSWVTPQQCDRATTAADAAPLLHGMLGCRAYQTKVGDLEALRSFTKLCSPDVVGCTAFYDTKNSSSRESQTFNDTSNPAMDDVTVPADSIRYLVNDPKRSCAATAKGCKRFGSPTLDRVGVDRVGVPVADQWKEVFLRDDPDRYTGPGAMLCRDEELFCEEYRGTDGAMFHFKDPGNRVCEYKKDVTLNGVLVGGWFQKGIDPPTPCYAQLVRGGSMFEIAQNSDQDYGGWAGTCDAAQNLCTEFRDPTDQSFAYPEGRRYYALRPTVDLATCAGNVSRKEGCVLLDETSNLAKTWSAPVSYASSEQRNGDRAPVTDCDRDPASCRRCVRQPRCQRPDGQLLGSVMACTNDAQCGPNAVCESGRCKERAGGPLLRGRRIACTGADNAPCGGGATVCSSGICLLSAGGGEIRREDSCANDSQCDPSMNEICTQGSSIGRTCTTTNDCRNDPNTSCERITNDANVIVSVKRDRQCSQWYERTGCYSAFNARLGRTTDICSGIQLMGEGGGDVLRPAPAYLTMNEYQKRDRSYAGEEYSGFAIPNRAGLEFLQQADIPAISVEQPEHGALLPMYCPANLRVNGRLVCGAENGRCPTVTDASGRSRNMRDGESCGPPMGTNRCVWRKDCPATDASCALPLTFGPCVTASDCAAAPPDTDGRTVSCEPVRGICLQAQCMYPAGAENVGRGLVLDTGWQQWEAPSCKAYPATDAPFPRSKEFGVLDQSWSDPSGSGLPVYKTGFEGVTLCRQVKTGAPQYGGLACECTYRKVSYGGAPQYYANDAMLEPYACVGGLHDGKPCDLSAAGRRADNATAPARSCQAEDTVGERDGKCTALSRNDLALGVEGYCLERDKSMGVYGLQNKFACRTFYPVDQLEGTLDVNSFVPEAGYQFASTAGRFMCIAARGNALSPGMRGRGQSLNSNRQGVPIYADDGTGIGDPTEYWVGIRLESQYDDNGEQEEKAVFTNARGPGDTTGLEWHPFQQSGQKWNNDSYANNDPIVDRDVARVNVPGNERLFLQAHNYQFTRDEIEKIVFRRAVDWGGGEDSNNDNDHRFIESDLNFAAKMELTSAGKWSACADAGGRVSDGNLNSLCWSTAQVNAITANADSGHNFTDGICEDNDQPTASNTPPGGQPVTMDTLDMYYGVKAIFDPNSGILLGFRTGFCKDVGSDDEYVGYDIFLVLKEMCTEVRRVARDGGNFPEAKPWTNRVWWSGSAARRAYTVSDVGYDRTQASTPFGTVNTSSDPTSASAGASRVPWYVAPSTGNYGGAPYACVAQCKLPNAAQSLLNDNGDFSAGERRAHEVFARYLEGWRWQMGDVPRCDARSAFPGNPCTVPGEVSGCGDAGTGTCVSVDVCQPLGPHSDPDDSSANPNTWYYPRVNQRCARSTDCKVDHGTCTEVSDSALLGGEPRGFYCVTTQYQRDQQNQWNLATGLMQYPGGGNIRCVRRGDDGPCKLGTSAREGACQPAATKQCSGGLRNNLMCSTDAECKFSGGRCQAPDNTVSGYVPIRTIDPSWDISGVGLSGFAPQAPVVRAIGDECESDGKCYEGPANQFTVNGQRSGEVVGIGGRLRANIRFFFHAHHEQMPIRQIQIRAGDANGRYSPDAGSYANRRNAGTTGDTQRPGPLQNEGCWDPSVVNQTTGKQGACVYVPRVYLKDNWGWCTGQCGNASSPGGTGCYSRPDLNPSDEENECAPQHSTGAWIPFSGRVVVFPR
ncbi:hypothetical protein HYV74_05265, partial [Candidatus Uhrbacteria bacterium]|nr:hypothetical protein [Candidatus Uhrbacteria bacterium]